MSGAQETVLSLLRDERLIRALVLLLLALNAAGDLKTREILPMPTLIAGAFGLIRNLALTGNLLELLTSLLPGVLFLGFSLLSRGGLGFGDGLLITALGALTGPGTVCSLCLASFLLSGAYAGILLIRKKNRTFSFPFVPFLLAGYLLLLIAGRN